MVSGIGFYMVPQFLISSAHPRRLGRHLAFDGRFLHGAFAKSKSSKSAATSERVTFLVPRDGLLGSTLHPQVITRECWPCPGLRHWVAQDDGHFLYIFWHLNFWRKTIGNNLNIWWFEYVWHMSILNLMCPIEHRLWWTLTDIWGCTQFSDTCMCRILLLQKGEFTWPAFGWRLF